MSEFIDKNLSDGCGGLLTSYFDVPGRISGFAEDYAFYIWGLLELYSTAGEQKYLERAIKLQDKFTEDFFDFDNGGFYLSGKQAEKLITRTKELYDGAVPSYNSVSLHNLLALYNATEDVKYQELLIKTVKYFSKDIAKFPQGYIHSISALAALKRKLPDIRICNKNTCRPIAKSIDELISYFE